MEKILPLFSFVVSHYYWIGLKCDTNIFFEMAFLLLSVRNVAVVRQNSDKILPLTPVPIPSSEVWITRDQVADRGLRLCLSETKVVADWAADWAIQPWLPGLGRPLPGPSDCLSPGRPLSPPGLPQSWAVPPSLPCSVLTAGPETECVQWKQGLHSLSHAAPAPAWLVTSARWQWPAAGTSDHLGHEVTWGPLSVPGGPVLEGPLATTGINWDFLWLALWNRHLEILLDPENNANIFHFCFLSQSIGLSRDTPITLSGTDRPQARLAE